MSAPQTQQTSHFSTGAAEGPAADPRAWADAIRTGMDKKRKVSVRQVTEGMRHMVLSSGGMTGLAVISRTAESYAPLRAGVQQ
jgi:hypothetical protein